MVVSTMGCADNAANSSDNSLNQETATADNTPASDSTVAETGSEEPKILKAAASFAYF